MIQTKVSTLVMREREDQYGLMWSWRDQIQTWFDAPKVR